ncbi:MAG: thiol:disulfide interchange protein DsbA/DsbL [Azonexus sp.]|nr:thiol:disulfide interchange protein DsbA/DsbL [Betaproteobacteria bacterium]MBK8919281.1 thiol:disulfide interchange protein DsbA/DsbL [Betaproteobacteria bacterium]MBP6035211.1 thiol:disulfide interchange protein DsbA/DsbL [Azonexus sp.]MBP6905794.1 thiol:disulfide interchange protein DsbA/DsbL [Azonexus sp.]
MNLSRRDAVRVMLGSALAASLPAFAQGQGREYVLIEPPQPTDNPGKIEVVEFFSYGCPHCSDFHPLLSAWIAKQAADVVVRKVPVTFGRAAWSNIARLFYALETTGDLARLDADVFKAIHAERQNLFEERGINEWVAKKGVDPKKFADAFASFGVQSKVKRGDQMAQAYRIQGVPALGVQGRYLVGERQPAENLATVDRLIAEIRGHKK